LPVLVGAVPVLQPQVTVELYVLKYQAAASSKIVKIASLWIYHKYTDKKTRIFLIDKESHEGAVAAESCMTNGLLMHV
jgi:hypothetical protein